MKQFFKVYMREFRLVFRDQGIMIFLFFLPLAYPVIYALIYNPELVRDVRMVVVDHDRTQDSRELVRKLDATQEIWITGYASNLSEAQKAMHEHDCYGILEIPKGFARKLGRTEQANAVIYSDMSLMLRYRGFLVAATNVMTAYGAEIQQRDISTVAPIASTLMAEDPLPIKSISMGNTRSGFDSFIMPGMLVLIIQQSLILPIGIAGGAKRENRWKLG